MSSSASHHTSLIRGNGDLYTFGLNQFGQLGSTRGAGTATNNYSPQRVASFSKVRQVSEGEHHTLVLLDNGDLYAMGYNYYGQLGIAKGFNTSVTNAVPTLTMTDVRSMACGQYHSIVLTNSGEVFTFGRNHQGQLGDGGVSDYWNPRKVAEGARQVGAGASCSFYISNGSELFGVGSNSYGQLSGNSARVANWRKALDNVKQVASGENHTLALLHDGTVMSFGYNYYGQLGVSTGYGTSNRYQTPRAIATGVRSVTVGGNTSYYLKENGDMYSFGNGAQGQTGTGTAVTINYTPTLARRNVRQVSAGVYHVVCVDNDGRAFAAGYNYYGQLGVLQFSGSTTANPNFVLILTDVLRAMGSVEVVFQLSNPNLTTTFHKEGTTLSATVSHVDSSLVSYRISVNKVQRFPVAGWTAGQLPDLTVTKDLPHTYFSIGSDNLVLLEVQDSLGRTDSFAWKVTKTNREVVITPSLSATQIHKDNVTLGGSVTDPDGDKVQYRVLLNNVQKYPSAGFTELLESPASVGVVINNADFIIGVNTLVIEAKDDLSTLTTFSQMVIKTNSTPSITGDVFGNYLNLQVADADNDKVQYRISVNGEQLYPEIEYTGFTQVPFNIQFVIPRQKVIKGRNNVVRVETLDELGGARSWEKTFVGGYSGLLFCDAAETFYSDDFGEVLRYLDFGTITAGQTTAAERVFVKNTLGYPVDNLRLQIEQGELDGVEAKAEVSKLDAPFAPEPQLSYMGQMEHNERVSFYVRIATTRQAKWGGMFDILVKADPRPS